MTHHSINSGNDKQVEECFDKLKSSLSHKNLGPLRLLKIDYIKALVNWCRKQPLAAPQKVCLFKTAEVLERICNVIHDVTTPTWLGSVPKNCGKASAGTIKADE
ncbi:hypothetical protein BDR03DRAFT_986447 [Suillus americanus]|nr:hypothetical protein BDR03DRAFT_986447 [Suillus americanus]